MPNKYPPLDTPPPLDVMKGLKEALVDPISKDWEDAYWIQRALRERYPAGNAALDFVPWAGWAASADDMAQARNAGDIAGAVAGTAINAGTTAAYAKGGLQAVRNATQHAPGMMGRGVALLSMGPFMYLRSVLDEQSKANQQYKDTSMREIAEQLRGWGTQ